MIDAHFHIWQLARADYGWLSPDLAPIYRDVSVADWQNQSAPCGIMGGVLVQAAPTEAETQFLLHAALQSDAVLGVVGWVDWRAADAPERIQKLAQNPRLKGLRPMLQDIEDPAWILQESLEKPLQMMARCGLVLDALVKSTHLPHILTLARRHPDLHVVIDHCAKPDIAQGEWQAWADGMKRLATETQASCKLSGLWTEGPAGCEASAVRPWAEFVLQSFGPERVMWGSDWPVLEINGHYSPWFAETQNIIQPLTPAQQQAVLGDNARRIYRL
jgi:L-fuconolactonase